MLSDWYLFITHSRNKTLNEEQASLCRKKYIQFPSNRLCITYPLAHSYFWIDCCCKAQTAVTKSDTSSVNLSRCRYTQVV